MRGLSSIYIVCYFKKINANRKLKKNEKKKPQQQQQQQNPQKCKDSSLCIFQCLFEISEFWSAFLRGKIYKNGNIF